jgi:hypothetical protein
VFGTATSAQAARTLAGEAGIDSGTVASLLHRLDHRQLDRHAHGPVHHAAADLERRLEEAALPYDLSTVLDQDPERPMRSARGGPA